MDIYRVFFPAVNCKPPFAGDFSSDRMFLANSAVGDPVGRAGLAQTMICSHIVFLGSDALYMIIYVCSILAGALEHGFYFSIYWEYSSQLTNSYFSEG